ncbi:MAG: hypothetical protein J5605_02560, partial [Bacteroidales bacterium]|nr:hypothetical protein [Bacteroidales bacterium]
MDKINSEKEFPKLILYLGSFLFISFLIIELICSFRNVFPLFRTGWLNTYVAGVFCRRLGFIPFLIGIILLVPITEEIVFRKWADYKKHSFFLSTICISLYLFISISWLAGIVAVAYFAIVFVTCGKKRIKVYRFLMLFATSFAFALTFNFRTTSIGILTVSDFLKNFGFSMVASYLVSNHSFTHSILLRMAYNVLLFVPMFLPCNLDVDGAKVNVGGIYSTAEGYYSFEETDSSFVFKGTMPEIAYKMAIDINMDTASDKNIFYDYCSSPDYVFSIEINNKSKEFLKKTLKEMNRHKMFIAD